MMIFMGFLIVLSCALHAGDITSGTVVKTITAQQQSATSKITYAFYAVDRGNLPPYQQKINELISSAVPFRMSDEDAPQGISTVSEAFVREVLGTLEQRYQQYQTSATDVNEAPWVVIDSTVIQDQVRVFGKLTNLAQVVRFRYEFTGGAHGNSTTSVTYVSKDTGKELSFASDMISDLPTFEKIAEKYFRKIRKIPAKRSLKKAGYLFDQGFGLSENIILTNDAVTLIYNPYECAPYVMGEIRVSIPLKDVANFIRVSTATP